MKTSLHATRVWAVTFLFFLATHTAVGQTSSKSLLINHGAVSCGSGTAQQQFFAGALTGSAGMLYSGSNGLPYGGTFTAYNPVDQKVYFADINGTSTKVYVLDYNFGGSLTTPPAGAPTYTYSYTLNQLCFDNDGNNYGFKSFNPGNGTAKITKVDIATGNEIGGTQRNLTFPAGHIPNTVGDGDIVILPNGRMFATFGNAPSILFELSNPNAAGAMTATFLANMPRVCYSIAFVDGNLVIAGSDGGGCYYYTWDINSASLSAAAAFPGGKSSADMTSLTAGVGVTKQVAGAWSVNTNTAKIYYRIVVKNKGNIALNNLQITDDLNQTFGAGNVTAVQVSMVSNPGQLQLNPAYNGTTDKNLLLSGQIMDNHPVASDSVVLGVTVTATNLVSNKVYYNSAVATGNIGAGSTYLAVSDSSNNGAANRMDLDGNGISDDAGENVPTPFVFTAGLLPVEGLSLQASRQGETAKLSWQTVANTAFSGYEIERSVDGNNFELVATVMTQGKTNYTFADNLASLKTAGVVYRIKGIKADRSFAFSNLAFVKNNASVSLAVYPNPFTATFSLQMQATANGQATVTVKDIAGRMLGTKTVTVAKGLNQLTLADLQTALPGTYLVDVVCGAERNSVKLQKQ